MGDQIIVEIIKNYGPYGISYAVLLYAIYKLVMRNEQLTDKYMALAIKLAETLEQNTASRNTMNNTFENLKRSIDEAIVIPRRRAGRHDDNV
jgi:hypothetical protein